MLRPAVDVAGQLDAVVHALVEAPADGVLKAVRYAARCERSRAGARRLEAIRAVLGDAAGEWWSEDGHLAAERRKIRNALAARAIRRHQLRHGTPPFRDNDLAPFPDLVQKGREVLAGLADSNSAHDPSVVRPA